MNNLRVFCSIYESGVALFLVSDEFEGERWGMEFTLEELEWVLAEAKRLDKEKRANADQH